MPQEQVTGLCQGQCGPKAWMDYTLTNKLHLGLGGKCGGSCGLSKCWGCGERYWGEWISDPPQPCDPCDHCGQFVGPKHLCCGPRWRNKFWSHFWQRRYVPEQCCTPTRGCSGCACQSCESGCDTHPAAAGEPAYLGRAGQAVPTPNDWARPKHAGHPTLWNPDLEVAGEMVVDEEVSDDPPPMPAAPVGRQAPPTKSATRPEYGRNVSRTVRR